MTEVETAWNEFISALGGTKAKLWRLVDGLLSNFMFLEYALLRTLRDMNKANTCRKDITPKLHSIGWGALYSNKYLQEAKVNTPWELQGRGIYCRGNCENKRTSRGIHPCQITPRYLLEMLESKIFLQLQKSMLRLSLLMEPLKRQKLFSSD